MLAVTLVRYMARAAEQGTIAPNISDEGLSPPPRNISEDVAKNGLEFVRGSKYIHYHFIWRISPSNIKLTSSAATANRWFHVRTATSQRTFHRPIVRCRTWTVRRQNLKIHAMLCTSGSFYKLSEIAFTLFQYSSNYPCVVSLPDKTEACFSTRRLIMLETTAELYYYISLLSEHLHHQSNKGLWNIPNVVNIIYCFLLTQNNVENGTKNRQPPLRSHGTGLELCETVTSIRSDWKAIAKLREMKAEPLAVSCEHKIRTFSSFRFSAQPHYIKTVTLINSFARGKNYICVQRKGIIFLKR